MQQTVGVCILAESFARCVFIDEGVRWKYSRQVLYGMERGGKFQAGA